MTRFDSSRAWTEASAAIRANREVVAILMGVFFFLPSLAVSIFYPQPEPPAGLEGEAAMRFMSNYLSEIMPAMIAMSLVQAVGALALLTLLTDRARPTVGEALADGAKAVLPYLAAQLLAGAALGLVLVVVSVLAAVGKSAALAVVGVMVVMAVAVWVYVRISLVAPVVAVERVRNPVQALQRSWALTRGQAGRLGLFYVLVLVAFLVAMMVIMGVVGVIAALALPVALAKTVAAVVSSAIGTVMALYLLAIIASAHAQLAGPAPATIGETFG